MRNLIINVIVFAALLEVLNRVDFFVLVLGLALGMAAIVCADLMVKNLSSRAQ